MTKGRWAPILKKVRNYGNTFRKFWCGSRSYTWHERGYRQMAQELQQKTREQFAQVQIWIRLPWRPTWWATGFWELVNVKDWLKEAKTVESNALQVLRWTGMKELLASLELKDVSRNMNQHVGPKWLWRLVMSYLMGVLYIRIYDGSEWHLVNRKIWNRVWYMQKLASQLRRQLSRFSYRKKNY